MDPDQSVLLLNSTFEPLTVLRSRRAINLLLEKKAHCIEDSNYHISSVRQKLKLPSVIQLLYYVRKPYKRPKFSKRAIFIRDNYICQYCKKHIPKPTIDHIIPKSKGGATSWTNVVTSCHKCNNKKSDQTLKEAGLKLARPPFEPKFVIYSSSKRHKYTDKWERYFAPKKQHMNQEILTPAFEDAY